MKEGPSAPPRPRKAPMHFPTAPADGDKGTAKQRRPGPVLVKLLLFYL